MLAIGNTKPERSIVGRNDTSAASWNATCWVSATLDTNSPRASAQTRNSDTDRSRSSQDPRIGRSNSNIDASTIPIPDASETKKYGIVLPTTNIEASSGAM